MALVLSRQDLPAFDRTKYAPPSGLAKGGYIMADAPGGKPDVLLIGTGSEVQHCVGGLREALEAEGIKARVVSMPSWDLFEHQPQEYQDAVIPPVGHGPGDGRAGHDLRLGAVRRADRRA